MFRTKSKIDEENIIKIKDGFNIINKRLGSLSGTMLSLKMEILAYKNGESQWTLSEIKNLFEDIRLDINELTDNLEYYLNFMLNNNPYQFEDLIREGAEIQKNIELLGNSFIDMVNLV